MKTYTTEELKTIIENHQHWLKEDCDGWEDMKADLCDAYLCDAYLRGAYLRGANLCDANLGGADLCDAYLCDANLGGAYLCDANLRGASLRGADLCDAYLCGAKNLDSVTYNEQTSFFALQCPETGAFIAWKKAIVAGQGGACIVELLVPSEAKRSSATSRKCRVSKAKVLSIKSIDGKEDFDKAIAQYDNSFVYEVGQFVEPKNGFGEDRWVECDAGIHCFITRKEAENY